MSNKAIGIIGGGLVLGTIGMTVWKFRNPTPKAPGESEAEKAAKEAANLNKTILEQHLVRIAMHKKALPAEDMNRAIQIAGNLGLMKTLATLKSIEQDGRPGGPNYVMLPMDELWPGTEKSVRRYVADAMAKLSAGAAADDGAVSGYLRGCWGCG